MTREEAKDPLEYFLKDRKKGLKIFSEVKEIMMLEIFTGPQAIDKIMERYSGDELLYAIHSHGYICGIVNERSK